MNSKHCPAPPTNTERVELQPTAAPISATGLSLPGDDYPAHARTHGKRILFVTHAGDPGGAELMMLALCRAERATCEVLLFQHGKLESLLEAAQVPCSVLALPTQSRNVRKEDGAFRLLRAIPSTLSMARRVANRARHFDVVVCFSQKAFVVTALAKPFMRGALLWFMNDILSREHFSAPLIALLVRLSRLSAAHIVLNSQASWDAWRAAGGRHDRVSVIYPGVQPMANAGAIATHRLRQAYAPATAPLIGMFGRLSRWKGQEVFLRALVELPDVHAIIVGGALFGEQPYERRLHELVRELHLEQRVTFVGHVEEPMLLMAACDVVVHCSTAPEPFGLVIVEAMLAGTPVVASDAGGAREIVTHDVTGQLTPPGDHLALAHAVRRYLEQPVWARELALRATQRARTHFTRDAMLQSFRTLTEAL